MLFLVVIVLLGAGGALEPLGQADADLVVRGAARGRDGGAGGRPYIRLVHDDGLAELRLPNLHVPYLFIAKPPSLRVWAVFSDAIAQNTSPTVLLNIILLSRGLSSPLGNGLK